MEGTEWPIRKIKCKHRTKATATRMYTFLCQEMFHLRTITAFIANVWPNLDVPRGTTWIAKILINSFPSFLHSFLFNYRRKTIKREHLFSSFYLYIYIFQFLR